MRIKSIAVVLLALVSTLHGGVADHLKKATNKIPPPKMRNVDYTYVINLDKRPEKFEQCVKQLEPYGIRPYRFSAVNGWELTLAQINDLGVVLTDKMDSGKWGTYYPMDGDGKYGTHEIVSVIGRNYFSHCMSRGAIGICLSHLSVLKDALDSGYETIWVMEDDIHVLKNPHMISTLIDRLDATVGKKGWDILFTDRDTKNQKGEYVPCRGHAWRPNFTPPNPSRFAQEKRVGNLFRKIGARFGAYSMIVRRSGMQKIYNFLAHNGIFLPFDLEFYQPGDIRLYTVQNDVVSTLINALSDNGAPRYKEK
ncbi:MAG: glycosyltransferase family 25 protein [Chlamydiia bacterium]|nr:glycosyltransferase family 25 protein [Chlamydiia bacterium]